MTIEERLVSSKDGTRIFARVDGDENSSGTVVFAHGAGVDLTIWDSLIARLPDGLRCIRFDLRGHGQSDVPPAPYAMGALVADAEAVCEAFDVKDAVFVGHGAGGMIAQGLAVKRLDLIRALVLTNTAAKIGNKVMWERHIAEMRAADPKSFASDLSKKWFGPKPSAFRDLLISTFLATDVEGYAGVCSAIGGTDFYTPTSGLRLPTLGVAGARDGVTPTDLVKETIDLIPGSEFQVMRDTGHFPFVENAKGLAQELTAFLRRIGHT